MSRRNGSSVILIALFLALLLSVPAAADNVTPVISPTTTTTAVPDTTVTTTTTTAPEPSVTTTTTTIPGTSVTTTAPEPSVTTKQPTATTRRTIIVINRTQPVVATTLVPTMTAEETRTTGSVAVYSSPTGASILIDGVYVGATPKTVTGVPAGNHILRLSLSGYYDYEGSIYIVPGQTAQGYGTLQPLNQIKTAVPTEIPTVLVPVIVTADPDESTADTGLLGNPSVLVAVIGVVTALIAAGASVFTHVKPPKKE